MTGRGQRRSGCEGRWAGPALAGVGPGHGASNDKAPEETEDGDAGR